MDFNLLTTKNPQLLKQIDWPILLKNLSSRAHFISTKRQFEKLLQTSSEYKINRDLGQLDFFISKFHEYSSLFSNFTNEINPNLDFENILKRATVIETLSNENLFECSNCLKGFFLIYKKIPIIEDPLPNNNSLLKTMFIKEVELVFDSKGSISYTKHPILKKLYLHSLELEKEIRSIIHNLIRTKKYQEVLQYNQFDIVHGKFVLPIKSDHYHQKIGNIITKSKTGLTLYIEPFEISSLNSLRLEIVAKMDAEVFKICNKLTAILKESHKSLSKIFDWITKIDLLKAKSQFCIDYKLSRPILSTDKEISIKDLFHPLLDNPIQNNITLKYPYTGLSVSGPNTGGKSVILKSLCLCLLLPHAGLFVPGHNARIFYSDTIYFFSNDFQNIIEGLSSFSAESMNYLKILKEAKNNLVLFVDEIFNSTESGQASILANSFFNHLLKNLNARIFLSTHHQQLKYFLDKNKYFLSAHMGFNHNTGLPTYKLVTGAPGNSHALEVFKNLEYKIMGNIDISSLIVSTNQNEVNDYSKVMEEALLNNKKYKEKLADITLLEKNILNKEKEFRGIYQLELDKEKELFRKEMKVITAKAEKLIEKLISDGTYSKKQGYSHIDNLKVEFRKINKMKEQEKAIFTPVSAEKITIGSIYYSNLLENNVKIVALNKRKGLAQVLCRSLKSWQKISSLSLANTQKNKPKKVEIKINIEREVFGSIEIDCRGMRLETFIKTIEAHIFEVINEDIPFLNIIHGHGNGILKDWLRNFLLEHKELSGENIEGNDGCTKVFLKS